MQLSLITLAIATLAMAVPAELEKRAAVCPAGQTPLCCQLDVDGVIDTTCESPSGALKTKNAFRKSCASTGLTAECCILPLAGDALLCTAP